MTEPKRDKLKPCKAYKYVKKIWFTGGRYKTLSLVACETCWNRRPDADGEEITHFDGSPIPDYKLSFGGRFSQELERRGYKKEGTCKGDNGVEGVVYRKPTAPADEGEKPTIAELETMVATHEILPDGEVRPKSNREQEEYAEVTRRANMNFDECEKAKKRIYDLECRAIDSKEIIDGYYEGEARMNRTIADLQAALAESKEGERQHIEIGIKARERLAEKEKEAHGYEEEMAAVLPEDRSLAEYVGHLRKRIEELEAEARQRSNEDARDIKRDVEYDNGMRQRPCCADYKKANDVFVTLTDDLRAKLKSAEAVVAVVLHFELSQMCPSLIDPLDALSAYDEEKDA